MDVFDLASDLNFADVFCLADQFSSFAVCCFYLFHTPIQIRLIRLGQYLF